MRQMLFTLIHFQRIVTVVVCAFIIQCLGYKLLVANGLCFFEKQVSQ